MMQHTNTFTISDFTAPSKGVTPKGNFCRMQIANRCKSKLLKHKNKCMKKNSGLTAVEVAAVLMILVMLVAVFVPMLNRTFEKNQRASCQQNFKQLGLAFKMYASESLGELYPPAQYFTDGENKSFAMSPMLDSIYPDYIENVRVLFCPSSQRESYKNVTNASGEFVGNIPDYAGGKASLMDQDYIYMAWAVNDIYIREPVPLGKQIGDFLGLPPEMELPVNIKFFFPHLSNLIHNGDLLDDSKAGIKYNFGEYDWKSTKTIEKIQNTKAIYRFREGIERFFITDHPGPSGTYQATFSIPLLIERPFPNGTSRHYAEGRHVFFVTPTVMVVDKNTDYKVSPRIATFPENGFIALNKLCDIPAESFPKFDIEDLVTKELAYLESIKVPFHWSQSY